MEPAPKEVVDRINKRIAEKMKEEKSKIKPKKVDGMKELNKFFRKYLP